MRSIVPIEIDGPVDVLIDTGSGKEWNHVGESQRIRKPVVLITDELEFGTLDRDLGRKILTACEPAGHNFDPTRQFPVRCALVRRVPEEQVLREPYEWDWDALIQTALALSRWVRPTGWGLDYAARVNPDGPGSRLQIIPATSHNLSPFAFVHQDVRDDLCLLNTDQAGSERSRQTSLLLGSSASSRIATLDTA